jgi:hypothetical protein
MLCRGTSARCLRYDRIDQRFRPSPLSLPPRGSARHVPAGGGRPDGAQPLAEEGHTRGGGSPAEAPCPRVPAQRWAACPFLSTWLPHLTPPATAPAPLVPGRSRGVPLPRAPGVRRAALPGHIVTHADRLSTGEPLVSLDPDERLPPRHGPRWRRGAWTPGRLQGSERWHGLCRRPQQRERSAEREDALGAAQGRGSRDRGAVRSAACSPLVAGARSPGARHVTAPHQIGDVHESRKRSGPQTMCPSSTVSRHRSLQKCSRTAFAASKPDCRAWPTCSLTRSPNGRPIDR